MPFYEFRCQECGHQFSKRIPWSEKAAVACPQCGSDKLKEVLGFQGLMRSEKGAAGSPGGCGGFG